MDRNERDHSAGELFQQLHETVEILAAPAVAHVAWHDRYDFAFGEMYLDLASAPVVFFPRLIESGLLAESDEDAVNELIDFIKQLAGTSSWTIQSLQDDPKWEAVRVRAQSVLTHLDKSG